MLNKLNSGFNGWFLNDLKIVYSHKESIYFLIRLILAAFSPIKHTTLGQKTTYRRDFEKEKRARMKVREKAN